MDNSPGVEKLLSETSISKPNNFMSAKMTIGIVVFIIVGIVFFIWTIYKRMKRLENQSKENQKMNNEMTNLKYAVQETMNNVEGIRRRIVQPNQVPRKTRSPSPVPVPVPNKNVKIQEMAEIPKPKKLMVEEVDEDDVEGESEIIEVEEDSDFESEEEVEE